MQIDIHPEILEASPELRLGHLLATVEIAPSPDAFWEMANALLQSKASLSADDIRHQPVIAASRADGHIDEAERARIMDKLKVSGLGADAAQFLEDELANPVDLDAIIAAATTEEQRVELYTASRLAIEPKTRAERGYLDLLAGRLGLADALVDHIEATVSAATV